MARTTVADLAAWLEHFAPARLAESWDNVGLLWGDPAAEVTKVMTCLTVTPDVAAEAVAGDAQAIVSHHPVLFRAVRTVKAGTPEGASLWPLARAGIAVLSPHTALDNTEGGINDLLAARLELADVRALRSFPAAQAPTASFKVVVFAPTADRERVLNAAFAAGAGVIGAYDECSYSGPGVGTFFGNEGASPAVGQAGRREAVREWRVELVCPADRLGRVLAAIRAAHSYEEPAIDVYALQPPPPPVGAPGVGRVGRLPRPESLRRLAERVAGLLRVPGVQIAGDPKRRVERVAIACGAGDDFLPDAARAGADLLLTGEVRFHRALEAESLGLGLILAGHHATERPGVEDLARRIASAFPTLTAWPSRRERDPLRPILARPSTPTTNNRPPASRSRGKP